MALKFLNDGYFAGKVGIGTDTPDTLLHLYNPSANWGTEATITLGTDTEGLNQAQLKYYRGSNSATESFQLSVRGTTALTALYNGNVGIGTTNPIGCLDIDDTFKLEGNLRLGDSSVYTGGWARGMITLYQNTSTGSKNFVRQGMLGNSDALSYYWHSMDPTTTTPWSVNAFRIYPNNDVLAGFLSGKVGIGTTSPTQKLHVVGNARVTGAYYDSNNSPGAANQVLVSTVTGTDWIDGSAIPGVPAGSGTLNTIPLWTPDGDTLGNSVMFQSSNNISIGITTPNAKLSVQNDISIGTSATDVLRLYNNSGVGAIDGYSTRNLAFGSATNGEVMRIDNTNGRVGIGTTSPGAKLHVAYSNSSVYSTTSPSGDLVVSRHNTSNVDNQTVGIRFDTTGFAGTTTGQAAIQAIQPSNLSSADLAFLTRNNATFGERMRITSTGDVGIGTTIPIAKLHIVSDDTTASAIKMLVLGGGTSVDGNGQYIQFSSSSNDTLGSQIAGTRVGSGASSDLRFSTTSSTSVVSERMRINSAGNVGIGTTSPQSGGGAASWLSLNGTAAYSGGVVYTIGSTTKAYSYFESDYLKQQAQTGFGQKFIVNGTNTAMTILSSGNVGIGTTSPGYKLTVNGDVDVNNGAILAAQAYGINLGVSGYDIVMPTTTRIAIKTSGSERVSILNTGNVGIGTTSPAAGLQVAKGGTTIPTAGSSTASAVFGNSTSDDNYGVAIGANSSGVGYISSQRTDGTATTYSLAIQPNGGNVGIGTDSPISKFSVVGDDNTNQANIGHSTQSVFIKVNGTNVDYNASGNSSGSHTFSTGNIERMRITSAGGISFGSTGTAYGTSGQILKSNGNASPTWIDGSAIPGVPGGSGTTNYLARWTPNGDTLGIGVVYDNGTNVGIGIDDPAARLEVKSNLYVSHQNAEEITFRLDNYGTTGTDAGPLLRMFNQSGTTVVNIDSRSGSSRDTYFNQGGNFGIGTTSPGEKLDVAGNVLITAALLSNQENTDVDTGTETVANVAIATYTAAFFDFVIKKTTNVRSGTVYACHDGTNVEFTETSTQDLGDTSDVTLSVDISGGNMRLRATTTSDDWSVKSLIRAI